MGEPALDLSAIIDLYKEDARRMVGTMQAALARWDEVRRGGGPRQDLRRLSHQLRGSGRTYGYRNVSRLSKAIESIVQRMDKAKLPADDRVRDSIQKMIDRLAAVFAA